MNNIFRIMLIMFLCLCLCSCTIRKHKTVIVDGKEYRVSYRRVYN